MTTRLLWLSCLALALVLLGGCESTPRQSWPGPDADADADAAGGPDLRVPLPTDDSAEPPAVNTLPDSPVDSAEAASKTASYALLEQSRSAEANGSRAAAIAYLERALRLTPRSAELWIELGRLQLPGAPVAAQRYARKALALTTPDTESYRQAWLLIAEAKELDGDSASARAIRDRFRTGMG